MTGPTEITSIPPESQSVPAASSGAHVSTISAPAALGAAPGSSDDELSIQFQQLSAAMDARMRLLKQQEEQVKKAEAALCAASRRMASASARMQSDIISLNVGGTSLATSRRTLTLVSDSLLGTMFSGSWDDHLQRDEAGRVFLDYDPSIFSLLLNWLRSQDMGGPEVPLWELAVEPAREEQLLVLIDFLQLQRYVPCKFTESFSPSLSSPFITLSSSSAWRAAGGSQGAYAMAATSHCFFDVDVDLHLEVIRFGAVPRAELVPGGHRSSESDTELPNHPMFVGVMARGQLAALDQRRKKSNASWQSTCYGWWTGRRQGCEVRQGRSKKLQPKHLWAEGDSLILSLDAAKHPSRPTRPDHDGGVGGGGGDYGFGVSVVRLSLTNTRTTTRLEIDILPICLGEYEEQWVVVVGLAGRGDEVRINTARRKGMKPHREVIGGEAVAGMRDSATLGNASTSAATADGVAGGAGSVASRASSPPAAPAGSASRQGNGGGIGAGSRGGADRGGPSGPGEAERSGGGGGRR